MTATVRKYDEWTGSAAKQMLAVFAELVVMARLRGERYGLIVGGDPASLRTAQLMYAEISELRTFFMDLANELRVTQGHYSARRGRSLVLDTNDLLHYQRLDKIPWVKLYGLGACVVIPHVVVDEIDRKSYAEGEKIRTRARGVYRVLEEMLDEIDAKGFAALFDGSTLEILADEPGHRRLPNNDDEVVARATFLQQAIAPQEVTVITRDIGMRTRARAWKLKAAKLPDKFLIPADKLSASDLDAAISAIEIDARETSNEHEVQTSSPGNAA
jgi:rRNA-processing protein FCF1